MRTTVNIDDELLADAKARARRRGVSLGVVIEEALRREWPDADDVAELPSVPVFRGTGVLPGVDLTSNRSIQESLDQGVDLGRLR